MKEYDSESENSSVDNNVNNVLNKDEDSIIDSSITHSMDEDESEEENVIDSIEFDKLSDKAKTARIRELYNKCKDIGDKIEFLLELQLYIRASEVGNMPFDNCINVVKSHLIDEFVESYIINGTSDQRKEALETVAEFKCKADIETYENRRMERNVIDRESDENAEAKIAWLVKNSKEAMESECASGLSTVFIRAYEEQKVNYEEFTKSGVSKKTTMSEFAILCGYRKDEISDYLAQRNVKADDNAFDYFVREHKKNNNNAEPDEERIWKIMANTMSEARSLNWISHGRKDYYDDCEVALDAREKVNNLAMLKIDKVRNPEVDEWIEKSGKGIINRRKKTYTADIVQKFSDKYLDVKENSAKDIREGYRRAKNIKKVYNELKTPEEKLDLIIRTNAYGPGYAEIEGKNFGQINDANRDLVNDFMHQYIVADMKKVKKVLKYYGKRRAEITLQLMNEENKYKKMFGANDKDAAKKARFLARCTEAGALLEGISSVGIIRSYFYNDLSIAHMVWDYVGISFDTTMQDLAELFEYDAEEAQEFYAEFQTTAETTVFETFKTYLKNIKGIDADENTITKEIKDKICLRIFDYWTGLGIKEAQKEAKLTKEQIANYKEVAYHTMKEFSTGSIQNWIDGEGKDLIKKINNEGTLTVINDYEAKYNKGVSYENYIRLHTGINAIKLTHDEKRVCLSKAVAANLLKKTEDKFDLDKIHVMASNIVELSELGHILADENALDEALGSQRGLDAATERLTGAVFKVSEANVGRYVKEMKTLYNSLMPSKNRSAEYKAFYGAIKKAAELEDRYDLNHEYDKKAVVKELVDINANILKSVRDYTKGKKAVRWTDAGKERFNNNLDALAIMGKYIPGSEAQIEKIFDRVNEVRWTYNNTFINEYGAKRAANAKAKRDAKQPAKNAAKPTNMSK